MLVLVVSVDCWSLNLITYPVLVVPTPATCTSFVAFAFRRAFRIWVLAESVGRYLVKVSVAGLASSGLSCVLIRRQLGSLFGSSPFVVSERLIPDSVALRLAAIDAHDRVDGSDAVKAPSCVRMERISSWSSAFWFLRFCCFDLISANSARAFSMVLLCCVMIFVRFVPLSPPAEEGEGGSF